MKQSIKQICLKHPVFFTSLVLLLFSPCMSIEAKFAAPLSANSVPMAEQALPTQIAKDWFVESPTNNILEGALIDREGNLLFCDISKKSVMRITPEKKLTTLVELPEMGVGGLAFHRDGRIFMAALDLTSRKGGILAWSPETKKLETIVPLAAGYWPNDLVFAPDGGFYFSDFRGNASNPCGGIYYVSPDFKTLTPVIANLAQANGVALSPDGRTLWATEFAKNRLHRAQLEDATTISATGSSIPYHFIGYAPDSMRVDSDGNVYVAMYGQGRVLIFDNRGVPTGQILLPEREKGLNLLSTSLAIQPDSTDLFIVSSNNEKDRPAKIFKAKAFAHGLAPVASNQNN